MHRTVVLNVVGLTPALLGDATPNLSTFVRAGALRPLATVLPAMLGVHAVIGVGEAAITVAAVSAVLATRPDLIHGPAPEPTPSALPALS